MLGEKPFWSDEDSEAVVLTFFHYMSHEKDSFKSIEEQFGLDHSDFNADFYKVLKCGQDWANSKISMSSLEK